MKGNLYRTTQYTVVSELVLKTSLNVTEIKMNFCRFNLKKCCTVIKFKICLTEIDAMAYILGNC